MARERRPANSWPAWFHAPNGDSAIYQDQASVPNGWSRKKQTPFIASPALSVDAEDTKKQLFDLGVWIDPRWGAAHLKKVLDEYDRSSPR